MDATNKNIIEKIKTMESSDFVYLGVLVLFFALTSISFFFSARFISTNINKVLSQPTEENIQALNVDRYTLIAKKLNIPVKITQ